MNVQAGSATISLLLLLLRNAYVQCKPREVMWWILVCKHRLRYSKGQCAHLCPNQ
jgi:hypothetical protein